MRKPRRLAHEHPEDRFLSTLRPRRELVEALIAYAIHMSGRRRRKRGVRQAELLKVVELDEIWVQASRAKLIERYQAHLEYLEREHPISPRTLTRQIAGIKQQKLLTVIDPSHFDERRREWVQQRNIYTITRAGILWIRRHARSLKIPSVV